MSLNEIINEAISTTSGALFAGVISTDGLGVEMVFTESDDHLDLELADLELSNLAAAAAAASERIGSGQLLDLMLETEDVTYLTSAITPGYYALMGVDPDASLGNARFAVRHMVSRIKKEL
ncbi:roadblock/LC7 domain-containing protein [Candidatus Oscillochloris fontis]|uniref:roadblock/LC7 domain-containing protein n=1 Tax=Candidatus Oscillochloris fontis TaxID=2496868 RepID=UPI00101BE4B5|nr:roadblock/LC7 domain-containing protein [Candidatus Oscillochloris fontis]